MRKRLFTLILAVVLGTCAFVHAQTIVLSESFENGLPAGWTQEHVIGSTSWTTETAGTLLYPDSTVAGYSRAVLRNETGETQGFKTRLITPVMNLDTVFQPILRYYHAQVKWTADFDTLRVLYRNTEDGEWQLLQEFTQPIQNWKKEELDLPQVSTTYQLCFEGTDNLGRGIVLDSVMVRSKPECTIPHDLSVVNMVDGGATLLWQASYDASEYQVVLVKSKEVLDIDTLSDSSKETLVVTDTIITGFTFQCRFQNLQPKTNYVAYVRSLCDVENSAWGTYSFLMKAVKNIPYTENFDMEQSSGVLDRISGWTYGNNTGSYNPFINTHQSTTDAKPYVMSGTALCFTSGNQVGSGYDIPAGLYVYAATPELNVESVQALQVRFWGSLGKFGSMNDNARAIIIGVMDDPEDVTTFVPVDTMKLWKFASYEEHITSFDGYVGDGKVIAFLSFFDQPNQFYIDNMTIELAPTVGKVMGVNAVPAITEANIIWNKVKNATGYDLLISTRSTTKPDTLSAGPEVLKATATTNAYTATNLTEGTDYYVYVKANGSAEWSNVAEFTTSCRRTIPMFFGLEEAEGQYVEYNERASSQNTYPTCLQIYSTDTQFPRIGGSSYKRTGSYGMYYSLPERRDAWVVFPYVDTIVQGVEIEFYMKATSTDYKNTAVEIGVMVDPDDLTTFTPIALAKNPTTTWKRFYANFLDYEGEGKYIALRYVISKDDGVTSKYANSYPYIDDITIKQISSCLTPIIQLDEVTTETAKLSWYAPGMTTFQLIIDSLATRAETALDGIISKPDGTAGVYYVFDSLTDTTSIILPKDKLKWGRTYYAYMRSLCDADEKSYWTHPFAFTLNVPEYLTTPYLETFEIGVSGSGTMAYGWTKADPSLTYPYLYGSAKKNGKAGLYFTSAASDLYAPVFDLEDLSKMMITFWGKGTKAASTTVADSLYIGVGNNPKDANDVITWLDTISIPTTTFTYYRTLLSGWEPHMGKRIVFSSKNTKDNTLYLDDINFESAINATPYDVETLTVSDVEASFTWIGESSKGWHVLVTKELVDTAAISSLNNEDIFFSGTTTTKPFTLTGLSAQTNYYVYLRPLEGHGGWTEGHTILTQCLTLKPGRQAKMTFEDVLPLGTSDITSYAKSSFPDCWVRHGADEDAASVSYTPFIYQYKKTQTITSTSYVHSGLASALLKASTSYYPAWFTTPELAAKNMENVTVKFWARCTSNTYQMELGVMVNPDDFSTYTKLADIIPGHTSWVQYSYTLEDCGYKPEMGKYITFAMTKPQSWTFYIDDIEIYETTCRTAKPILSKLTHNTVRVTYSSEPLDMRIVLAKDTVLNADSLDLNDSTIISNLKAQGAIVMDTIVDNKMGYQFANLESDTDYSAAFFTLCDEGEGFWAATSWTTMCTPVSLEEVELIDFEKGYNDTAATTLSSAWRPIPCWVTGSKTKFVAQTYIPYVLNNANVAPSGSKSLRFYTSSSNDGAYAIMPALDVEDIRNYELTFLGRATTGTGSQTTISTISSSYAASIIVGVVTDPSDISTFVAVDTITMENNAVYKCKVRFSSYTGDANDEYGKFVAFMSEFKTNNNFFIDNISITPIQKCSEPLDIEVDTIGDTMATVRWNGTTDAYRVVLATEKLTESEWEDYTGYVQDDTIQSASYTFSNLVSNTRYFVYVKGLCDGQDGKWNLNGNTFTTDCAASLPLPYVESFDNYAKSASSKNPISCWTTYRSGAVNADAYYPSVYNSAKYGSTGNGLYWSISTSDSAALKRPTIASLPVEDVSKLLISFKLKTTSKCDKPSSIAVGYATDISSVDNLMATVHFVDTLFPGIQSSDWVEHMLDMREAERVPGHVVLQQIWNSSSGTYLYMDDLMIEKTPSCFVPLKAIVLDSTITYDQATIQITPFSDEDTAWDVMMVSKGGADTVRATVDTTTAVINGLKHSTYYTMYVRTNCGGGDVSNWSDPVELITKFKIGDGMLYTFEDEQGVVLTPLCYTTITGSQHWAHPSLYIGPNMIAGNPDYTPYQVNDSKRARNGKAALQLYNTSNFQQAWVALPMIQGEDSLQMRFDMRTAIVSNDSILDTKNYGFSSLQIGVIDENHDLDSYEVLAEYKPSTLTHGEKATAANNYLFDQIVLPLPQDLSGKRIVLLNPTQAQHSYIFIDDLRLEKKQGWQTPVITTSNITPTTLTLNWSAFDNNKWNVYLTQGTDYFPFVNVPESAIVDKQEALTTPTATFTDLQPNTEYFVYVQVAGQTDIAATSVRRLFKTPMDVKIATDSIITFEGSHTKAGSVDLYGLYPYLTGADTIYAMSNGWYVNNLTSAARVYTPWARLNDYAATSTDPSKGVVVAYAGERALQLYPNRASASMGAYAVMPEVDGDYDTLQVNFYARPFSETADGMVSIKGTQYKTLVVGTMTDPNNTATFQVLDSLYYSNTSLTTDTLVASLKNNGFQYFSFRLTGAKGKYIVFSAPNGGQWYIDNISFSEHTCLAPSKFKATDVTKNSAFVSWYAYDANACVVQVAKTETFVGPSIVFNDTIQAESVKIENLESVKTYYVRVRELCSADEGSNWSKTSFTTECYESDLNYSCGFEVLEGINEGESTTTYDDIAVCWLSGTTYETSSNYLYVPRIETSSSTSYKSRNTVTSNMTSANSLRMYATVSTTSTSASSNYDQWAVMPRLDLTTMDPDSAQLEFYALPGAYNPTTGKISTCYTNDSYLPSVIVGVMTDPTDITTFTPLDTCTYETKLSTSVVAVPENDFMFQHFIVPLEGIKGKGEYLAFKTYLVDWRAAHPTSPTTMYTQMFLDDVSLQKRSECFAPEDLNVSNVLTNSVTLNWVGDEGASWIVTVSKDMLMEDDHQLILKDTVSEMTIDVLGLNAKTTYYWTVQQICTSASFSIPSAIASFSTAYVPLFHEEFVEANIPLNWSRDTTRACYIFDGTPLKGYGTTNAWVRDAANFAIYGPHMSAPMNSLTGVNFVQKYSWLTTPIVCLDGEQEAWLTFYAALSYYNSSAAAEPTGWDDQFMVVISDDGGKTWKRENAIVWNNETSNDPADSLYVYGKGDYVLNELPATNDKSTPITISLAKYKGKPVKVAFYSESMVLNANNEIHVADVHINYVNRVASEVTTCQFEDFVSVDGNFRIDGDVITAGAHNYQLIDLASYNDLRENANDKLVDTLYTFQATIIEAPEFVIEKTICEGEVAGKEWGFQDRSTSGVYRRKGESAVTGCDSIATLVLTVIPRVYTEEVVDICSGTSYEFNGKLYNETGVYVDTLSSVVTGCDSIATLILTVNPPITHEYEAHICTGSSYYFTENYPALTMSGKYIETLKTVDGCDSIVTLNLVVSDVIEIEVFDTICAGDSYEFAGEQYTEAGAYPITYESTMGCDSTVTLHLYVNEAVALQLYDTICAGSTYTYNGQEYTEAGVYEFTYTSAVGCDSVVTLNLVLDYADTIVVDTTINELDLPYFYPNTSVTYPKGTEPGVYVDTVMVAGDSTSCGYLLVHKLTIIPGTAVDNVIVSGLLIKPSLIEQGESVTITGFSGNKATVYVYDMVGRCVEQLAMTGNSIELNTFTTSGVYTIRVMDANGEQHVGRVMVK